MKLIHCSDFHLDSKLETNLNKKQAQERNRELGLCFEKMVQYALSHQVKAILICGDLFDSQWVSDSTFRWISSVMEQASSIQFFYLRGNHDEQNPAVEMKFPANVRLFTDQWRYYRSGSLMIAGVELTDQNTDSIYDQLHLDEQMQNIVMLHGQVSTCSGVDQVNLKRLSNRGIDYLALGHIHRYEQKQLDHRGVYCYSGCPEGRGFDECGEKGFVLLDVGSHGIHTQFVPFAKRQLHSVTVNISHASKITEILTLLRQSLAKYPDTDLVQVTLTGTNQSGAAIDVAFLEQLLADQFYSVKIKDESRLSLELVYDTHDISLKSEFIRSVSDDPSLSEDEIQEIILIGLTAFAGEEGVQ